VTRYLATPLPGVTLLDPDPVSDERGLFARTWDPAEAAEHGIDPTVAQCSTSYNRHRGTLRGMHYQAAPYAEAKLVRCTAGAIFDVALDLRPGSPTFRRWHGVELSSANRRGYYLPEGIAHGFVSLTDDAEVYYQISAPFHAESARGVRWDDPAFGIEWPIEPVVVSERDQQCPLVTDGWRP
jgi:dTDP-4-dehydrorhamnose 3,5-epimerase